MIGVRAVGDLSVRDDVMTAARDDVACCVAIPPRISPLTVDDVLLVSGVAEAGSERGTSQIAVELPTVRERMHLLATGAPVEVAVRPAPEDLVNLSHGARSQSLRGRCQHERDPLRLHCPLDDGHLQDHDVRLPLPC
jgi:hypothetical protein